MATALARSPRMSWKEFTLSLELVDSARRERPVFVGVIEAFRYLMKDLPIRKTQAIRRPRVTRGVFLVGGWGGLRTPSYRKTARNRWDSLGSSCLR